MTLSSVRGSTAIPDTDLFGIISGFDMMQFRGAANGAKTDGAQLGRMKRVSCQLGVDDVQLRAQPQQYTSMIASTIMMTRPGILHSLKTLAYIYNIVTISEFTVHDFGELY